MRSNADSFTEQIGVYKAMGGGWIDSADASTPAATAPLSTRIADQPMF